MDLDKNELKVQERKPDIVIKDTPLLHMTSITKDVVEHRGMRYELLMIQALE